MSAASFEVWELLLIHTQSVFFVEFSDEFVGFLAGWCSSCHEFLSLEMANNEA